ncbi:MAG: RNA methyltransferase [Clostridia bacterium]|nr:RNA methyltransferase [Clostridia bacterium]
MRKRIESRNNPTIKNMNLLRDRREREREGLFYFEGVHLLEEYLRAGHTPFSIFVRDDVINKYSDLLEKADCEVFEVPSSVYDKLTDEKAPQGIFTVSKFLDNLHFVGKDVSVDEFAKRISGNSIMLVDLQDNGNVGTVIRTSAAMGCDVILCGKCADIYSSKTVRATMGALFMNDVYICPDTLETIKSLQNSKKRVIASALDERANVLGEFEIKKGDCFVVGNEGQGLADEVISACDMTAIIPMSGKTESLNAASAASMLLWEAKRGGNK